MKLIETVIEIAMGAGEILKKGFGSTFTIESKTEKQDLVTSYDHASQDWIIQQIKKAFPSHTFLAEEKGIKADPSKEFIWIIDPLDGTVNFAHEIPFYAVSLAVAKEKDIICGVVFCPTIGELFVAEKGSGAFLGKRKLAVTKKASLETAFMATGFPYDIAKNPLHCIERFGKMTKKGIPIRRLGVASLDISYVAAGRFDAFWEVGLHPWDMAAAKLILEEAGGKLTHYDGKPHQIFSYSTCLATNGYIHEEMVSYLKEDLI